MEAYKRL